MTKQDGLDIPSEVPPANALREGFLSRFQIVPALTEDLKDVAYRIRHNVYCEDLKWEPIRPSGREMDEYDSTSVHVLLRQVVSREYVGCVRMVRARAEDPAFRLPIERVCEGKLDKNILEFASLPRSKIAEVSRLAIISKYRRREGEADHPAPTTPHDFGTDARPRFPFLVVGLYVGIIAMAKLQGVEMMLVLTEPRLAQHFKRVGVREIKQIGPPIEHRGTRIPSLMPIDSIISGFCMNPLIRPIYEPIYEQVSRALRNSSAAG